MCGIVGIYCFGRRQRSSGDQRVDEAVLTRMRDAMVHRGPDAAANWISADRRVELGHRRLSIIDLSASAEQPCARVFSSTAGSTSLSLQSSCRCIAVGSRDTSLLVWSLYNLTAWYDHWIDCRSAERPAMRANTIAAFAGGDRWTGTGLVEATHH